MIISFWKALYLSKKGSVNGFVVASKKEVQSEFRSISGIPLWSFNLEINLFRKDRE